MVTFLICVIVYLKRAYGERDDVYRLLRNTFSLPLLPAVDIPPAFHHLKTKSDAQRTDEYFKYIDNTWNNQTKHLIDVFTTLFERFT